MSENDKSKLVAEAKNVCKWFKLTISLSIFDHEIIHWEYPPKRNVE